MREPLEDTLDALDALLEEERTSLLVGNLDAIADLHLRKTRLIEDLSALDAAYFQENLETLQDKVDRNQVLLDSALSGIRSVARRLAAVRRVRESLEFYEEDGKKSVVDVGVSRTVEKRA